VTIDSPLPRGRHQLTREEVAADQRRRMFEALGAVMAEKGYVNTTVADILKRAKVSRETFYQQFDSKQACFMASFERHRSRLIQSVMSTPFSGTPGERFDALLGRYLATLAEEPDTARLYLIEVYAAGPEVLMRRAQLQKDFVNTLVAIFHARSEKGRFACEALVAAISAMTTTALIDGGAAELLALHAPLVGLATQLLCD
jgi:AcrR family transcriptional regulator